MCFRCFSYEATDDVGIHPSHGLSSMSRMLLIFCCLSPWTSFSQSSASRHFKHLKLATDFFCCLHAVECFFFRLETRPKVEKLDGEWSVNVWKVCSLFYIVCAVIPFMEHEANLLHNSYPCWWVHKKFLFRRFLSAGAFVRAEKLIATSFSVSNYSFLFSQLSFQVRVSTQYRTIKL